jgi:hypothetical protein
MSRLPALRRTLPPRLRRLVGPVLVVGILAGLAAPSPRPVAAAADVFVNTTADLLYEAGLCLPSKPCSLRAAIGRIEGRGGNIRACYDPAEVGGSKRCPPGWQPLTKADPGYDAARGKWIFAIGTGLPPLELATDDNVLDFSRDIDGWDGPEDNRVVLTSGTNIDLKQVISLELGTGNKFMGFEVSGHYQLAGIDVLEGASGNQFGPGMIFAGIDSGVGLRFYGSNVTENRVVGSWCGITGDGTDVSAVADDCIQFLDRAHDNVVGGSEPGERNVIAASRLGVGVAIRGGSSGNQVVGNWLGIDAQGKPLHVSSGGVTIAEDSHGARVAGNLIGGNRGPGVAVSDGTRDVVIEDNKIGTGADGMSDVGNRDYGVRIVGAPKGATVSRNRIAFNGTGGIYISGGSAYDHTVTQNSVTDNDGPALQVLQGANRNVRAPQITAGDSTHVSGISCGGCRVEVFSDPGEQADVFEVAGTAATDGIFRLERPEGFTYRNLTATATDGRNTSGLSAVFVVGGPTPTSRPVTPSPTPTRDPTALHAIWLPWLGKGGGG